MNNEVQEVIARKEEKFKKWLRIKSVEVRLAYIKPWEKKGVVSKVEASKYENSVAG